MGGIQHARLNPDNVWDERYFTAVRHRVPQFLPGRL